MKNLHFYKLCLSDTSNGVDYRTYNELLEIAGVTKVDYLKMDIEGFEWAALYSMFQGNNLPSQISFELHVMVSFTLETLIMLT